MCDNLPAAEGVSVSRFRISSRVHGSVDIEGSNWLVALGEGLAAFGIQGALDRIACEALPNGQILVRDVRTGQAFAVQSIDDGATPEDVEDQLDLPRDEDTVDVAELGVASLTDEVEEIHRAATEKDAIGQTIGALRVLVPSQGSSILLLRADNTLAFAAATGPGAEQLQNVSFPADTGIAGFSVKRLVSVALKDAYTDPRFFKEVDTVTGTRTRTLLCVPIAYEDRVYGCLEAVNAESGTFSPEDMADASILADALAQRLSNGGPLRG
jgi:GAF domain-containing protein